MKDIVKAMAYYGLGSVASVVGMCGGAWLWSEVLEPKAKELKEKHQQKVSKTDEELD